VAGRDDLDAARRGIHDDAALHNPKDILR
jgi:hypothetical protein